MQKDEEIQRGWSLISGWPAKLENGNTWTDGCEQVCTPFGMTGRKRKTYFLTRKPA